MKKLRAETWILALAVCLYIFQSVMAADTGARKCPKLETPGNGKNSKECEGSATVGDHCTFSCFDGFLMKGEYEHRCTEDLQWQPPHPPACVNSCPKLEDPVHGNAGGKCDGTAKAKDQCHFTCIDTKKIKGSSVLTCKEDFDWDNPPPTCDGCSAIALQLTTLLLNLAALVCRF